MRFSNCLYMSVSKYWTCSPVCTSNSALVVLCFSVFFPQTVLWLVVESISWQSWLLVLICWLQTDNWVSGGYSSAEPWSINNKRLELDICFSSAISVSSYITCLELLIFTCLWRKIPKWFELLTFEANNGSWNIALIDWIPSKFFFKSN